MNHRIQLAINKKVELLCAAPERLESCDLQQMLTRVPIDLLAMDEAHCISQWGHDFHPGYLRLAETIDQFQRQPTVIALTTTATPWAAEDIVKQLRIPSENEIKTGFVRENLSFQVAKDQNRDVFLLEYLKMDAGQSGTIHTSARREVERIYHLLESKKAVAEVYHRGMSEQLRSENQEAFLYNQVQVMVTMSASGIGINKSNVRFVIHAQVPENIESYYQGAGRAGRDGLPNGAMLIFAPQDLQIQQYFIEQSETTIDYEQKEYLKLRGMSQCVNAQMRLQKCILHYFGEEGTDYGRCSNCLDNRELVDITVDAQKVLSCVKRMGGRFGRGLVGKVLTDSKDQKIDQWHFDRLPTYGLMKGRTQKEATQLIGYLTAKRYLIPSDGQFPLSSTSTEGVQVLLGERGVFRKEDQKVQKVAVDDALFERLHGLHVGITQKTGVLPYVVFFDNTLKEMCGELP